MLLPSAAVSQRLKDLSDSLRDVAAANLKAAGQQVTAAQQALLAAQQQERAAQVSLDTAQDRLGDCFLKVPISAAVVVAKKVEPGERVAAYQSVFTVMDVTKVHVEFRVPDMLLGDEAHRTFSPKVSADDSLDVFVEALGWEKFIGIVTKIAPAADPATRTFLIEVTLNNPRDDAHANGRLRPGTIASISIGHESQATLLPLSAIQSASRAGETCVYVLDGDAVHQRRVVLGGVYSNGVEILPASDLKPGERVVVGGADRVSDNGLVRVLE
jgi:RND family efflux transporter MFP subunit